MQILIEGVKPDTRKKFRCIDCGCVWIADKNEYMTQMGEYQSVEYACPCPCCGKISFGMEMSQLEETAAV